jgi:3-oxoacyl-[acyl-carrier-protein] synthase II
MERKRVVVTGMGVLTPVSNNLEEFAEAIFTGKNGIAPLQSFDASKHDLSHGGEVKGFEPGQYFSKLNYEELDRSTQLAVAASKMAYQMANLDQKFYQSKKTGCIFGTTMGNQQMVEKFNDRTEGRNEAFIPNSLRNFQLNVISSATAAELGLNGINLVIPTACAAGNYAIGYASDLIKSGKADCMICGGSDAMSRVCFTMFLRLGAMSPDVCRPFDVNRHGMIVSEGAAALVLESYENAKKRNAPIYAEIAGYGNSCDAYHVTAPHPEGRGAVLAMKKALKSSNICEKDIQYISAHGTGTKANDEAEALALKKVFGDEIRKIPVSSIKSMIGHTMGAAAAIEAVASVLVLNRNRLPVNMNLKELDSEIDLNIVKEPMAADVQWVLSNSFAFGGNISSLVLGRED